MNTIVGLFRDQRGIENAMETLQQAGVTKDQLRLVTQDSNVGVELGGAGGGHIFAAELARGATLLVIEAQENLVHPIEVALRKAGVDDIAVQDDPASGNWSGTADGARTGRAYGHDAGVAGKARAEGSERNSWNEAEELTHGAEMGAGAAAGGTMGAPLGAGVTQAAGGLMGATPGEHPADEAPRDLPNPTRQADIERARRESDPAP